LMPPARVIAGPRALLTSILLVTRVPCRGSGAGGRTLAHKQRLAEVARSQVPPARLTHRAPTLHRQGPDGKRDRRWECYHRAMTSPLRALASLIVGLMTVVGMVVYQHYSREPPSDGITVAVTAAASSLAWLVTGLE
jgi:hypothetical protein